MSHPIVPRDSEPCVWMSAGLLTYRLCDRDFDCERCPLDAALRGESAGAPPLAAAAPNAGLLATFPEDRLYSSGHLWVQTPAGQRSPAADRSLRIGLDGFAAAILGRAADVRWDFPGGAFPAGETICELDLDVGFLPLGAPVAGDALRANRALDEDPGRLLAAPYGEGWLAELEAGDGAEHDSLLPAEAARDKARLDLRRFRRRIAFHLLAAAEAVGPTLGDGGEPLTDLRQILGGARYLELLRELVH